MNKEKYIDFFNKYIDGYLNEVKDESEKIHMLRKKEHTMRVVDYAMDIAHNLELDEDELDLIFLISLFHDIGRFEQFKKYKTFVDKDSINHSEQGLIVINKNNLFKEFEVETRESMKRCILAHNMKDIPSHYTLSEYLYCSILRDADKLDIIYAMINIIPKLPEKEQNVFYGFRSLKPVITREVYDQIMNYETIDTTILETKLDKQVFIMGNISSSFVNTRSFEIIKEQHFLKEMFNIMETTDEVIEIYNLVKDFVDDKVRSN